MTQQQPSSFLKYSSMLSALVIIVCFFLPWVKWINIPVSASDMATGNFYTLSETHFAITNPFPQILFVNGIFWLIPALCVVAVLLVFFRKTFAGIYGAFAGAMVLGLGVVYTLFTNELQLFDNNIQLGNALQTAFYVAVISAILLVITSWHKKWLWKVFFLIAPLGLSYLAFSQIKESQISEKTAATNTLKVAYTIDALKLINEFVTADSVSNITYREKIMVVEGQVSELNASNDGATLSMLDSTGSYVIFDFEKENVKIVQGIKVGDRVSVKGVCSGSIYSDILETQTITFKQSIIYSNK
ncbi:MAG: hypothetical protein WD135_06100 [Ferruginibacter sp.]